MQLLVRLVAGDTRQLSGNRCDVSAAANKLRCIFRVRRSILTMSHAISTHHERAGAVIVKTTPRQ